jgi:aspartate 1-decarboxylase
MHYAAMTDEEYAKHHPKVVIAGPGNTVGQMVRYEPNDPSKRRG